MGLPVGTAVVGDMGYGGTIGLTAVGDGVDVASRLEGDAEERDVDAVVSAAVLARAGRDRVQSEALDIAVQGRDASVEAVPVADATTLARVPAAVAG